LGNANGVDIIGQNGGSSPGSNKSPSAGEPERPSSLFSSGVDDTPTAPPELCRQVFAPDRFGVSRDAKPPNVFRHLPLFVREESRLVFKTDPGGLAAEQFRLLRQTLKQEFATGAVLLITSPGMGDGKTLTSVNLCTSLVDSEHPTLLLEMDVRRPKIREILANEIEPPGLEDALAGKVEPSQAIYWIKELNLHAAMVIKIPENPCQLISGVKHFLEWARKHFFWILLDAPPVLPTADVSEILTFSDAALLVIRANSTPRELSKRTIELLGRRLRGVIFNEVTVSSNPDYCYLSDYTQGATRKTTQSRSQKRSKQK
jgi:Mrp family chromosome partitioning ATPase